MVRRARDLMGSGELSAEEVAQTLKVSRRRCSEGSAPPATWMISREGKPLEVSLENHLNASIDTDGERIPH
jgi:hypothetical protein